MATQCPVCSKITAHNYRTVWKQLTASTWQFTVKFRCQNCGHRFSIIFNTVPSKKFRRLVGIDPEKQTYHAIYRQWGLTRNKYSCGYDKTILLVDIKDSNGNLVRGHHWFRSNGYIESLQLQPGDSVKFTAKQVTIENGYVF
ncbi:hypothetical protein [Methanocella sp. MCL-LM]|uniref:hypothetical protein n=1 Tax=Methanocella sp. MCL-LM TaxID=3412035 RepID=UPI003C71DA9E